MHGTTLYRRDRTGLRLTSGSTLRAIIASIALLFGATSTASAGRFDDLQLVYHATFGNGSLDSGVDPLKLGPLALSESFNGGIASWTPKNGNIELSITRPVDLVAPRVSSSIFATGVSFGTGSIVGLEATFVAPSGPHDPTDVWAVVLWARTGGVEDLVTETGTGATLQVRANGVRLNAPGASPPLGLANVPQPIYDAIFDTVDPTPFTLRLLIDRVSGNGMASLIVGDWVLHSPPFEFVAFKATSGPTITAVGTTVSIQSGSGKTATVQARNFKIFSVRPKGNVEAGTSLCPPEFGCREVQQAQ